MNGVTELVVAVHQLLNHLASFFGWTGLAGAVVVLGMLYLRAKASRSYD